MRSVILASCLGGLILGCGGQATGVRSDASAAGHAANAGSAEAHVNSDADTAVSGDAEDTEASCDWIGRSSVWIGQTDMTVTVPDGDYDGGDPLLACPVGWSWCPGGSSTPPNLAPEKVVLILNPITDWVTGTITFGEDRPPAPPTDPKKPYPPPTHVELMDGAIDVFTQQLWLLSSAPYPGFSYSLVSSSESDHVLHLAFVPAEVEQGWCALQDPKVGPPAIRGYLTSSACVCDGGACRAAVGAINRIDLVFDCNTMQGQLLWADDPYMLSSGPVAIRLQRVQ
jgi:hypothetical protein